MSEREVRLLLEDIVHAIEAILNYTENFTFDDYENDQKTKHAVERNFEIIGEAATMLPDSYKVKHTQVEWRILKDFRNFIIHDYIGINDHIIWETIKLNLPELLQN